MSTAKRVTDVKVSSNTPDYFTLRDAGTWLPSHAYKRVQETSYSPIELTYNGLQNHFDTGIWEEAWLIMERSLLQSTIPIFGYSEMENQVLYRLADKVRNVDLDLGVALGEYRETSRYVTRAITTAARSFRDLRRLRVRRAIDRLKRFVDSGPRRARGTTRIGESSVPSQLAGLSSSGWLQYKYAISPLMADVNAALHLLDEGLESDKVVKVRTSKSRRAHASWDDTTPGGHPLGWTGSRASVQYRLRGSGGVLFRVDDIEKYTLTQVGLTNPALVAWELVPFSFVLDWFIPVGDYLSSIVPPSGVTFLDGWTSILMTNASSQSERVLPYRGDYDWNTRAYSNGFYYDRKVLADWPRPRFTVPDLSLSKGQVASAMALLYKVVLGR